MRPFLALYVGGMGSREKNFYNELVQRYGFEDAAEEVQDLYLDGKKEEAAAALRRRADRHDDAGGPARAGRASGSRSTARPASARSTSRRSPSTSTSAGGWSASWRRCSERRGAASRRRILLAAFGDPGHAFPAIALGARARCARARGAARDLGQVAASTSSARACASRPAPEYQVLPDPRAAAEALRGGRAGRA